jgi:hypothetical protein
MIRSRGQLRIPQDLREALDLDEYTGLVRIYLGKAAGIPPSTGKVAPVVGV